VSATQQTTAVGTITVGFVGLGSQGAPMARRIVEAGFPLVLWARRPGALSAFADTAAEPVRDLAELGARADHVGHGAKLLAKDVGLLGSVMNDDPSGAVLRRAAEPFLDRIARAQVPGDSR
jgi:phosphoglycerate dehydrogenase-like enzyme